MATGKPTNNNRAAQQAKLRRAKSGKRRTAHKRTTRKHTSQTQIGGVGPEPTFMFDDEEYIIIPVAEAQKIRRN
jgi:hypothetical protein